MTISRNRAKKLALISFKYGPIITALIMLIHSILVVWIDCYKGYAETFFGVSLISFIIAYLLSKGLGFCKLHRIFIDYAFKVYLCMQWHLWFGFSVILITILSILILLGIGLFIYFFIHFKEFNLNCLKE